MGGAITLEVKILSWGHFQKLLVDVDPGFVLYCRPCWTKSISAVAKKRHHNALGRNTRFLLLVFRKVNPG